MKPETKTELAGFLSRLPDKMAAYLAAAIERDRLSGSQSLPHAFILDALRPVLTRAEPRRPRTPTPLRLVCAAFEDLLVSGERRRKQPGRISRASIVPVWDWVTKELIPARANELCAAVTKAVLAADNEERERAVAELQKAAASAILESLRTLDPITRDYRELEEKLGGPAALLDAREIALMMEAAPDLKTLRALPKPIDELTDEQIASIRAIFDEFIASRPDQAPYIALMVMGRLERPWEAMRLASAVSRKTTDTVISASDLGVIGELLFSDAEELEQALRAVRQPEFDPRRIADLVEAFASLSNGIVKELGIRKDGKWGQRLMKCRAGVAETMEAFMERAPREILAVLPVHPVGGFGTRGPRRPNLSRLPDGDKIARAERYAALLALCRHNAANAAFGAAMNDALDEVAPALRTFAEDVLAELRAAQPEARAAIEAYLELALKLCTLLLGEEEADLIRRRGATAHAAAS